MKAVLASRRQTLGHLHEDMVESINVRSVLHEAKGDLAATQPLYEEALLHGAAADARRREPKHAGLDQ